MKYLASLLLLIAPFVVSAQIINTIAGKDTAGFSGDGGAAVNAKLNQPSDIAFDKAGNLFVVDAWNHKLRKISTSGVITSITGYVDAWNIAINKADVIYFTDAAYGYIYKIKHDTLSVFAGVGWKGYTGDGGAATSAAISPAGLAVDKYGNVYFSDWNNGVIRKIDTAGIINTFAAPYGQPGGLAVDTNCNLYVTEAAGAKVVRIDTAGNIFAFAGTGINGYSGDGGYATAAQVSDPENVTCDAYGNVYISDANATIRRVDAKGKISTIAGTAVDGFGGDGGPATGAMMSFPHGMAIDKQNNLYFADQGNNRIRAFFACPVKHISLQPVDRSVLKANSVKFFIADALASYFQWQEDTGSGFVSLGNGGIYSGVTTDTLHISSVATKMNNYKYRCLTNKSSNCVDTSTAAKLTVYVVGLSSVNSNEDMKVYPNPAKDVITVNGVEEGYRVQLYNMVGIRVADVTATFQKEQISIGMLPDGMYILKIVDKNGATIGVHSILKNSTN